ncbi:hypothetical protein OIU76_019669 [Salix suchowensis]|nr:hypothetical protein OIU76_019669 [Salix suchowensis]
MKVYLFGCVLMGAISVVLFMEHSPPLYHAYFSMTVFLWTQIVGEYQLIKTLCRWLSGGNYNYIIKILASSAVSIFILEFLVNSFTERKLYTCACWFLSVFTLMPAEIPDNNGLVIASGAIIVIIGAAARWLDQHSEGNKYWLRISYHKMEKPRSPVLFFLQALLVGLSSVMVSLSTSHRKEKQELHAIHQLINWSIAGFSMVLPLFSENSLLSRLTSIFLGFAPSFLLLSIGYEAVFYGALALVLVAWILFENTILHLMMVKKLSASMKRNW